MVDIQAELDHFEKKGLMPKKVSETLRQFFNEYEKAVETTPGTFAQVAPLMSEYMKTVVEKLRNPFEFGVYHDAVTTPIDFYAWGMEIFRPLIHMKTSTVTGWEHLSEIDEELRRGENVILFSNHQTEADPQVISLLLEERYPKLAREMIFVAGHRVTSDPLTVPFSMGRNLLCIYSKRHMENPPEQKAAKQAHNLKAMKKLGEMLAEGGKCVWVAPSGGRDRADEKGVPQVAPFAPRSVEVFLRAGHGCGVPTHYYPLSLACYHLLPPPDTLMRELGEKRDPSKVGVKIAFGKKVDEQDLPQEASDRQNLREQRAEFFWNKVKHHYEAVMKDQHPL